MIAKTILRKTYGHNLHISSANSVDHIFHQCRVANKTVAAMLNSLLSLSHCARQPQRCCSATVIPLQQDWLTAEA